jgi:hypothetical protein
MATDRNDVFEDPTGHLRGDTRGRHLARRFALIAAVIVAGVLVWWTTRNGRPGIETEGAHDVEALRLEAGATAGELADGDAERPGGQFVDAWVYSTDTDEPILVTVAAAFTPDVVVYAPDGSAMAGRPDSADPHVIRVSEVRGKGTYRIEVSSINTGETGRYVVTVAQDPIPLEIVPDGLPNAGELGMRGHARPDGRYNERHSFEAREGQPYLVIMDADSLFAHVVIRSPEGDSLPTVSYERLRTAHGRHASVARFTPRYPGVYVVDVVSDKPGGAGHYMVALRARLDPVPVTYQTLRGVLGLVSRQGAGGYVDVFSFDGQAGRPVAFEVRPAGFTLNLIGPAGDTLEAGPRVGIILPKDGPYRVEVSSTVPRGTGSYDLIPAIPPVPPPPPDTTEEE